MEHDEIHESLLGGESRGSFSETLKAQMSLDKFPKSYLDKQSLISRLPITNCFNPVEHPKLTRQNLKTFYGLALESDVLFDEKESKHVSYLVALHQQIFGVREDDSANVLKDERWKDFGFQSDRPASDFRGGGLLSLRAMLFFSQVEDDVIEDIKVYMLKNDHYLFACVVISSVFFLKAFFHFGLFHNYHEKFDRAKTCSQRALKYFLSLDGAKNHSLALENFFKLVVSYNVKLYAFWKQACNANKALRIIDFKQAETLVNELFKELFEKQARIGLEGDDVGAFISQFESTKLDQKLEPLVFH